MSFTQVNVTGTILNAENAPLVGALVQFTLSQAITDGITWIDTSPISITTNSSGQFALTLQANDDPTTTPVGTFYTVQIDTPTSTDTLNVVISRTDAPSIDIFSLARLPVPAAPAAPYVSQIVAGSGVTITPVSGTGQVTINSSGGGASGGAAPWAASTVYAQYQLVSQGGRLYVRKTAGTSASTWSADETNWTPIGATVVNLGSSLSGTVTCDLSQGDTFIGTQTGNCTFNFTNWPPSPALTEPLLILTQDSTGGRTITITGVVWEPSGTPPTFNTGAGQVNIIPLSSPDQGTHLYGSVGGTPAFGSAVATKTAAYTLQAADQVILADATAGAFSLTLPTAVGFAGMYVLTAATTGTNLVTVGTTSSQTIIPPDQAGASTITLGSQASGAPYSSVTLVSDGSNWRII